MWKRISKQTIRQILRPSDAVKKERTKIQLLAHRSFIGKKRRTCKDFPNAKKSSYVRVKVDGNVSVCGNDPMEKNKERNIVRTDN